MPAPETIKTDNGNSFLSRTFLDLFDEMKQRQSTYFTLTKDDGGALALLTCNTKLIERIECALQQHEDDAAAATQEASHAGN